MRVYTHVAVFWLQENENVLVSACADGTLKIWDVAAPPQANPLRSFEEHQREVISLFHLLRSEIDLHYMQKIAVLALYQKAIDDPELLETQQWSWKALLF